MKLFISSKRSKAIIGICVFAIGIGTILKKFISYPTGGCIEGGKKLTQNKVINNYLL